MLVKEVKSICGSAIVQLTYDEIRDLDNVLFKCEDAKYQKLAEEFKVLHILAKEGDLEPLKAEWMEIN